LVRQQKTEYWNEGQNVLKKSRRGNEQTKWNLICTTKDKKIGNGIKLKKRGA